MAGTSDVRHAESQSATCARKRPLFRGRRDDGRDRDVATPVHVVETCAKLGPA
jgi:hypothetical protein